MAKVKIQGNASGSGVITLTAPNTSTDRTVVLPDADVTLGADATKLPLAGGTMTGMLDIATSNNATQIRLGDATSDTNKDSWIVSRNHTASEEDTALIHARCGDSEASLYLGGTDAFNTQNAVTDIRFLTAANTTTLNGTERMRVTNNGLTFNGDTAAANALNDYEEGTWTPTISGNSSCSMGTIHNSHYTKIGSVVTLYTTFQVTSSAVPATGALVFGGFPFAFKTLGESAFLISVYYNYRETPMAFVNKNGNVYYQNTTVGGNNLGDLTAALHANQTFGMTFSYLTDA